MAPAAPATPAAPTTGRPGIGRAAAAGALAATPGVSALQFKQDRRRINGGRHQTEPGQN